MKRSTFLSILIFLTLSLPSMDNYLTDSAHSSAQEFSLSSYYSDSSQGSVREESLADFIGMCELRACEEGFAQKVELYKYAIKELIEQQHQEKNRAKKQKKQKWLAMTIGAIVAIGPTVVTIIQALQPKDPSCVTITTSP